MLGGRGNVSPAHGAMGGLAFRERNVPPRGALLNVPSRSVLYYECAFAQHTGETVCAGVCS